MVDGRRIVVGSFNTLAEAVAAHEVAAREAHGEFACRTR
jgi:hypothetical protein